MPIFNLSTMETERYSVFRQAIAEQLAGLTIASDSLSLITAQPHPSHPGMNIYARNKDGSIAYRLCAIDSELSLFSADGTKYWGK